MIIKTKILAYLCEGPVHNNLYLLGTPGQNYMLEEAKTEKWWNQATVEHNLWLVVASFGLDNFVDIGADISGLNRHMGPDSSSCSIDRAPPPVPTAFLMCLRHPRDERHEQDTRLHRVTCWGHPTTYPPRGCDPICTGVISKQDKEAYLSG
jgi:hypothetical protein